MNEAGEQRRESQRAQSAELWVQGKAGVARSRLSWCLANTSHVDYEVVQSSRAPWKSIVCQPLFRNEPARCLTSQDYSEFASASRCWNNDDGIREQSAIINWLST